MQRYHSVFFKGRLLKMLLYNKCKEANMNSRDSTRATAVSLAQANAYFFLAFTFLASSAPALNLTTFFAGILILALVMGLMP